MWIFVKYHAFFFLSLTYPQVLRTFRQLSKFSYFLCIFFHVLASIYAALFLYIMRFVGIYFCVYVCSLGSLFIYSILVLDLSFGLCICLQGSLFLCKIVWLSLLVCIFVGLSFCMYMYIVCMYIVSLCLYIILQQVGTLHYFVCYFFFSKGMNKKCLLSLLSVVMVPS